MSNPSKNKFGKDRLIATEQSWESIMGGSIPGKRAVFRGKDVFSEFKNLNWLSMLYFCACGVKPSKSSEKFLNGLYSMCFNYADPRIWNNRVAALAGNALSTAQLAVCAASAMSEAKIYGGPAALRALDFLYRAKNHLDSGKSLEDLIESDLKKHKVIFGFGRPVNINDERVIPALDLLKELNLYDRYYIKLLLKIEAILKKKRMRMKLNVGGVIAAFCADEKISPMEIYYLLVVCFYVGQLACYIDTTDKNVGTLFPLRCNRITYSGHEKRKW